MENRPLARKYEFAVQGSEVDTTFFFEFFFSFHSGKVWSFIYPFIKFHRHTMLFDQCSAHEKEATSILAGYMNGPNVIIDQ